jgi:hypothetical protein
MHHTNVSNFERWLGWLAEPVIVFFGATLAMGANHGDAPFEVMCCEACGRQYKEKSNICSVSTGLTDHEHPVPSPDSADYKPPNREKTIAVQQEWTDCFLKESPLKRFQRSERRLKLRILQY